MTPGNVFGSWRTTLAGVLALLVGTIGSQLLPALVQYLGGQPGLAWQLAGLALGAIGPALMADAKKAADGLVALAPKPTPSVPPAVIALLVGGALLFAAPARADDAVPPGLIPSAGICNAKGSLCVSPAFAVVPYAIDLRSGSVSRDIAFAFGYGLTFPKALTPSLIPGIDLLGGVQTGGGWMAGLLPRIGPVRAGILLTHKPGATYAQFGLGGGY